LCLWRGAISSSEGVGLGTLGLFSIVYLLPSFVGGIGILRRIPWAQWILWIEAGMLALVMPAGTALAGLSLWALITKRQHTVDGGMAAFEAFVQRTVRPLGLVLVATLILWVTIGAGYRLHGVIDSPRKQVLTPLLSGVPDPMPERPEFRMPDLPRAPAQ
jgi:hypothetical protein